MKNAPQLILVAFAISPALACPLSRAQELEDATAEKLVFKTDWKGERIRLPPRFAPEMALKGIEEIRFAPGMLDVKSDSFFTYAFVFSISADQKLTEEVIRREILTYYRGLATAVLKSKGVEVDAAKFTFELKKAESVKDAPESIAKPEKVTQYSGNLAWVEPFATAKAQTLHFEIQAWSGAKPARSYLFVCTSPKAPSETDQVWKDLRGIRRGFTVLAASER